MYRHDPVFDAEFGALAAEFYCRFGGYAVTAPRPLVVGASAPRVRRGAASRTTCKWPSAWRDYLRRAGPPSAAIPLRRLGSALDELVARKQAGDELVVAPPVDALNEPDDSSVDVEDLNGFFRRYALGAWLRRHAHTRWQSGQRVAASSGHRFHATAKNLCLRGK